MVAPSKVGKWSLSASTWLHYRAETFIIPALALLASAAYFSVFLICLGKSPGEFFFLIARGGFGTLFSWQNTLVRAAPLILTALCVAIPARMGLVVIGGEGALVIAGFSAGAIAIPLDQSVAPMFITLAMGLTAVVVGACWIGLVGWMRHARGVNETISSLLLTYIAIAIVNFFIEGVLRNPADPNRPSTKAINPDAMVGAIPGLHVHWGLAAGVILAVLLYLLMDRTTFGFAARIAGGNPRVAEAQGLSVGRLIVTGCFIGGACAGLAGFFEVAAVHGRANAALHANYGFTGILVSFLARHSPLAIIPVACLVWRHWRRGRPHSTTDGASGRNRTAVARGCVRHAAGKRNALRPAAFLSGNPGQPHMSDLWSAITLVLIALLGGIVRVSTPFLFVSLGECLTEKAGRINLGLEGTLVLGAMTGYAASYLTGSPWLGIAAAALTGMAFGAFHAILCQLPRVNDIAVGIALIQLGTGAAFFFGKPFIQPTAPHMPSIALGWWSSNPDLQNALLINPLFPVGIGLAIFLRWAFRNTYWGLIVRTTGDSEPAARDLGVSVNGVRLAATSIGGLLAGIGGAFLSLSYPGSWNEGLSSGQGLMAVALVIFARWDPVHCFYAAVLFGAAGAIGPALQSVGVTQGYYFFNAAPYILTLLLMVASGRSKRAARDIPRELAITR